MTRASTAPNPRNGASRLSLVTEASKHSTRRLCVGVAMTRACHHMRAAFLQCDVAAGSRFNSPRIVPSKKSAPGYARLPLLFRVAGPTARPRSTLSHRPRRPRARSPCRRSLRAPQRRPPLPPPPRHFRAAQLQVQSPPPPRRPARGRGAAAGGQRLRGSGRRRRRTPTSGRVGRCGESIGL